MATLRSDAEVRQDVFEALTSDIRIDATRISIDVVDNVVILRGTVPSHVEKRTAEDVVRRIKGVRDVANELRVVPAQPRPDEQIEADVHAALAADAWVDERRVDVRVSDGIVSLAGTVDAVPARSHAEADAWGVAGVVDVLDQIVVEPPTTRTDAEIAREVRADIEKNLRVNAANVAIEVRGGTVRLRGTVTSLEQKWLADEIAWWTAGVRDVVDELKVGPPAAEGGEP
ncbi:MAG TPA: BON domain-containing protein [Chloroflexota bacterium]|nr:BON domain-containing protein [Chloroflexota bacterium]